MIKKKKLITLDQRRNMNDGRKFFSNRNYTNIMTTYVIKAEYLIQISYTILSYNSYNEQRWQLCNYYKKTNVIKIIHYDTYVMITIWDNIITDAQSDNLITKLTNKIGIWNYTRALHKGKWWTKYRWPRNELISR